MKISICVCTYNRKKLLRRLLEMLQRIQLDASLENVFLDLLVIDNSPSVDIRELCSEFAKQFPFAIHYVAEDKRGVSQARNRAVHEGLLGGASFIAFIDDDDLPRPDWLSKLVIQQEQTGADIVFGCWVLAEEVPEWVHRTNLFKSQNQCAGRRRRETETLPWMASTCNVLVKREVFEQLGTQGNIFDPELSHSGGEDKDFFLRAQASGATVASATDSIVIRHHESERFSLRGILSRGFKNGCSRMKKIRSQKSKRKAISRMLYSCIKLLAALVFIPFCLFSRGKLRHQVYRLGKASGAIYFFITNRNYAYYSHRG